MYGFHKINRVCLLFYNIAGHLFRFADSSRAKDVNGCTDMGILT